MKLAALVALLAWSLPLACASAPLDAPSPAAARFERLLAGFALAPLDRRATLELETDAAISAAEALFRADTRARIFDGSPSSEPIEHMLQLAERGAPRALRWLVENIYVLRPSPEATRRLRSVGATVLCTQCGDEPWASEFCRGLPRLVPATDALHSMAGAMRDKRAQIEPAYRALAAHATRPEVRDVARFELARMFEIAYETGPDTPADLVEACAIFEALARDAADPELARDARRSHFALSRLRPGMQAPTVATTDTEGVPFRLDDYRGRVVLLLFWGFW